MREIFDLRGFVVAVEATDNVISTDVQTDLYLTFRRLLDRATRWFVQHRPDGADIGAEIELFEEPVAHLSANLDRWLQGVDLERFESRTRQLQDAGVSPDLARRGAGLLDVLSVLDIAECARSRGWTLEGLAGLYFALSARLSFEQTLTKITALPQTDRWGSMARASMRDDLYAVMIELTATIVQQTDGGTPEERIDAWLEQGGPSTRRAVDEAIAAATAEDGDGLATLSVAVRRLRSLVRTPARPLASPPRP